VDKSQDYYSDARNNTTASLHTGPHPRDAIDAAKNEVELAEARFSERVRRVSNLGNQLAEKAWSETKPLLLVTAAVATVATVAIGFAVVRSGRSRHAPAGFAHPAQRRSLFATLALGLATQVAKNVAERIALGVLANVRKQNEARS
jgi:hypothetical protein